MDGYNRIRGILLFFFCYPKWSPEAKIKLVIQANQTLFLCSKILMVII